MNARDITKKVVRVIVTTSVTLTVKTLIKANTPVDKQIDKIEVYIGSWAIGAVVSDRTGRYTDKLIDEAFDWYYGVSAINPVKE